MAQTTSHPAAALTAAVVGAGTGGKLSAAALDRSPHFALVAVADVDSQALQAAQARYPDIQTFLNPNAMLATLDADVVCISTPPALHEAGVAAALNLPLRGLLVEKPLGHSYASGAAILEAVRIMRQLPLAVPHGLLARPTPRAALQRIQGGDIGDLTLMEIQCSGWDIINAGIHWLDFCVHATAMAPVDHVMASCDSQTRTYRDGLQVETAAVTYVQLQSGARIVMQTGDYVDVAPKGKDALMRFVGTRGQLEFWPWTEGYRLLNARHPRGTLIVPEGRETRSGHQIHLDNLAAQIARGEPDYAIAEASLQALAICEAAYLSHRHQCKVPLPLSAFEPPAPTDWQPGSLYRGAGGGRDGRALP